jgi:hypothetical protein
LVARFVNFVGIDRPKFTRLISPPYRGMGSYGGFPIN